MPVLYAAVPVAYLILAWAVYGGLLPITAFWGAAMLSVLPGRSFVAFAQVSGAARREWRPQNGRQILIMSSCVSGQTCHPCHGNMCTSTCTSFSGSPLTVRQVPCSVTWVSSIRICSICTVQHTHQQAELVKPLKPYAIKWHTALGLGLCAGLSLSPLA